MIITVRNKTQFPVILDGTLFHPGKYATVPATPIPNGQSVKFEVQSNTFPGGIDGGNAWMVVLDNFGGDTWAFATGWIESANGERKAGVAESSNPDDGNRAATTESSSITSTKTFIDKDGQSVKFVASATPDFEDGTILFSVNTACFP